jgi:hypothetical protein
LNGGDNTGFHTEDMPVPLHRQLQAGVDPVGWGVSQQTLSLADIS